MKIYSCLLIILFLSSCFNQKIEEKKQQTVDPKQEVEANKEIMNTWIIHTGTTNTWTTSTGDILFPINEKTTTIEQEFSSDLNGLLNLVNEDSNEK